MSENPIATWDFTLKAENIDVEKLKKDLGIFCKKWCFQLEKGSTTGYLHYQGRISLKVRKRDVKPVFKKYGYYNIFLTPTSTTCRRDDFYVMKDETRVKGPWMDEERSVEGNETYVPRDIKRLNDGNLWRPFQSEIYNQCLEFNEDRVNIIIHPKGMAGKTKIVRKCCIEGRGCEIPFCNDFRDVMRMAFCCQKAYKKKYKKDCPAFFIDIPRAINKEKLYQMYGAIEKLKSGFAYEDRYKYKVTYFDPPRIFVFTNSKPDLTLLSDGRWILQTITDDYQLTSWYEKKDVFDIDDDEREDNITVEDNIFKNKIIDDEIIEDLEW